MYAMQAIKVEIPGFIKSRDKKGHSYYNYGIVVTCPAPFKRWKVERRYCQFLDLFTFFSGARRIKTQFPIKSILQFSWSKSKIAKSRRNYLEAFLVELLGCADLRVDELDRLYRFLDVELDEDGLHRDSDFGDLRRELFPEEQLEMEADQQTGSVASDTSDDIVKLTSSFNSEFRPTDDLNTDHLSSPARILLSVASFRQESDTKEWHYSVSADGMKEALRNNDKKAVVELLKKSKPLATQVDDAGNPMIYTAALYGAIDLGIALIKAGADPQAMNRQGISAMDVAFDPWREAIMRFIDDREQARMKDDCKYETVHTAIRKNAAGSIGLSIARTTDNMPLVLGLKATIRVAPEGSESSVTEADCVPDIKPNDIISAINGVTVQDVAGAVNMIKEAGLVVELTLTRRVALAENLS